MAGELCRYTVTSSDPNDEGEEDIVHTAAIPARIVQTSMLIFSSSYVAATLFADLETPILQSISSVSSSSELVVTPSLQPPPVRDPALRCSVLKPYLGISSTRRIRFAEETYLASRRWGRVIDERSRVSVEARPLLLRRGPPRRRTVFASLTAATPPLQLLSLRLETERITKEHHRESWSREADHQEAIAAPSRAVKQSWSAMDLDRLVRAPHGVGGRAAGSIVS